MNLATTWPTEVHDLLTRIVALARELEPFLIAQPEDSVYIDYRQGSWTEAMVAQFRREIYPYPAAVDLLQFAAENPGKEVSYRDFLQRSSWTNIEVRSDLGAISKVSRRLFGKKAWPMRTRQTGDGGTRYLMPEGIAEWWRKGGPPAH